MRFVQIGGVIMNRTKNIALVALFVAFIVICSWIVIPFTVPFTLQTLAIFTTCLILGGKLGTIAIIIYILIGVVGLPVFSGFNGGIGAISGPTGGYIIGFIFTALIFWLITGIFKKNTVVVFIAMILGLITCYAFGTTWFMFVYLGNSGSTASLTSVLITCVFPFIIPDIIKIILAIVIGKKVRLDI